MSRTSAILSSVVVVKRRQTSTTTFVLVQPVISGGLRGCQKMSAATEKQSLGQHPSSATPPSSVFSI
ncbi:hypothetical protein EVAR_64273_1 [Eumeta japonica]|uniref:Uncharacterized protein n=1 Tax=Eumeta variegata TaxID=151549 RepID=A0A4C2A262_EUMVA|nr:hypothetical protein EVAR_64273_1 [Eumeta japonica]